MKYFEVEFTLKPASEDAADLLSGFLADIGFDSFVSTSDGLKAYIPQSLFDKVVLQTTVQQFPMSDIQLNYSLNEPEDKNWNEVWEKNYFNPVVIEDQLVIHSTFHTDVPSLPYRIIINPQMAFGTGHHETTGSILAELLEADLAGKRVLDMGCGTAILAILARMRGAASVTAIDIDDWCTNNALDNIALNGCDHICVKLGDVHLLKHEEPFDIVIANINRNILLQDLHAYVTCMKPQSMLFISGFYTEDIPVLRAEAERLGLIYDGMRQKNNWAAVRFRR